MNTKLSVMEILDYYQNNETEKINKYSFKTFKIQQAFKPADIIWENYGLNRKEKFISRTQTIITTILVMAIFYGTIWYLKHS